MQKIVTEDNATPSRSSIPVAPISVVVAEQPNHSNKNPSVEPIKPPLERAAKQIIALSNECSGPAIPENHQGMKK